MTWYRCAKAVVLKVSDLNVAAMDLRSSAAWRGLKKVFNYGQIWSSAGFPYQVRQSRGKEPAFISM